MHPFETFAPRSAAPRLLLLMVAAGFGLALALASALFAAAIAVPVAATAGVMMALRRWRAAPARPASSPTHPPVIDGEYVRVDLHDPRKP